MKSQWALLVGLLFAIVIAVFAVVNVEDVNVDYVFGEAQWPLILVILFSALLGAVISISFAIFKMFNAGRNVKNYEKQLSERDAIIIDKDREIARLQQELSKPTAVPPYTETSSYVPPVPPVTYDEPTITTEPKPFQDPDLINIDPDLSSEDDSSQNKR